MAKQGAWITGTCSRVLRAAIMTRSQLRVSSRRLGRAGGPSGRKKANAGEGDAVSQQP